MKYLLFILFFNFMILSGCRPQEKTENNEQARELYKKSVKLIKTISHNISISKDSIEVDSLIQIFEKKITEINFSFPSETDYGLTEQENDSIYLLIEELNAIKRGKLTEFAVIPRDTIIL